MRTTVAIDDHLLDRAKERARQQGETLGGVIEHSLRSYLARPAVDQPAPPLAVFHGGTGLARGINPSSNADLYDIIDADENTAIADNVDE